MSDILTIDGVKYSRDAGQKSVNDVFWSTVVITILAAVAIGICSLVGKVSLSDANTKMRKDEGSTQFFTAVNTGEESVIEDDLLRRFYRDLTNYERLIESITVDVENALYPQDLTRLYVDEEDYPNLCRHFHEFTNAEGYSCDNSGVLSEDFLIEYALAKSGDSEYVNMDVKRKAFFSFSWDQRIFIGVLWYVTINIVGFVVSFFQNTTSGYYQDKKRPWYSLNWDSAITGLIVLLFGLKMIGNWLRIRKERNRQEEALSKRHFNAEIRSVEAKIATLEAMPNRNDDINEALRVLRDVRDDLANHDTAFQQATLTYLAREYADEAGVLSKDAQARIDALRDVENL